MTGLRNIGLGLVALAACALLIVAFPFARKAAFCDGIVNPWDLNGSYVIFVPEAEHHRYNQAFLALVRKNGFMAASKQMALSEVDGDGKWFLSRNSTACDGYAYVWSHNVAHPDEFVVSFHSNWLLGKNEAATIERTLLAEFGPRYRIRPERDVARERGY